MTFRLISNKPCEYPFVQLGIKRAEMPLEDFIYTAQMIRSLELEYNQMRWGFNERTSTLYDLLQKSYDPSHEISTVIDKGPNGEELYYSNRKVLQGLKLVDGRGEITECAKKILENGTKLNSSHTDGDTRVVITYTECLSRNSPSETKEFLEREEREAMDLNAPSIVPGRIYMNDAARRIFGRVLGRRRRED